MKNVEYSTIQGMQTFVWKESTYKLDDYMTVVCSDRNGTQRIVGGRVCQIKEEGEDTCVSLHWGVFAPGEEFLVSLVMSITVTDKEDFDDTERLAMALMGDVALCDNLEKIRKLLIAAAHDQVDDEEK